MALCNYDPFYTDKDKTTKGVEQIHMYFENRQRANMSCFWNVLKRYTVKSLAGAVFFSVTLTPYFIFWVGLTKEQYITWLWSNILISIALAPTSVWFIESVTNKIMKKKIRRY